MEDKKNVFISHVHEDDHQLPKLKELLANAGMEVRDGSIHSDKPNEAKNEDYIKQNILAPRIQWASTLVVVITHETVKSDWVNWEIEYAAKQGKTIVGVYAQGATDADIPEALKVYGDTVVGWQGDNLVAAINGKKFDWKNPETGKSREPEWVPERFSC